MGHSITSNDRTRDTQLAAAYTAARDGAAAARTGDRDRANEVQTVRVGRVAVPAVRRLLTETGLRSM